MAGAALAVTAAALLAACGGGGGDSSGAAALRVVNATLTHPSLDLLQNSATAISATATDTASAYASVGTGTLTLQLDDSGTSTALAATSAALSKDAHYALLAYESGGAVKTVLLSEDLTAPASGTAQIRLFDAAVDAGALDVYITDPSTDLATVSSPTVTVAAPAAAQAVGLYSYAPGTYRVRVTLSGNKSQLLLDMPAVVLGSQQIVTVAMTPAAGGILLDGSMLVQQGSYAAVRNTNARVRLAAAVSGGASVSAGAGSAAIDSVSAAPAVGTYAVVPASGALNVSVGGASVAAPAAALQAGRDYTLLVHGASGSATAALLEDDNRLPASTGSVKMRLVNGLTGSAAGLTLVADFNPVATGVLPGAASAYGTVAADTAMEVDVTSSTSSTPVFSRTALSIAGSSVYTVFVLGDSGSPQGILRRDR